MTEILSRLAYNGGQTAPVAPNMTQGQLSPQQQVALVERIRRGEAPAEEELARLFTPRVLLVVLMRTRDREAARDLAQEVLLAVLRALRDGQVREAEKLAAFVYGTARNLANNFLRTRQQQPQAVPLAPELALEAPAYDFESKERQALVRRALEQLDPTDRRILLLTLVEGAKPGNIAQRLGLNPEVVRTRKSRAIKKVSEAIKKLSRK